MPTNGITPTLIGSNLIDRKMNSFNRESIGNPEREKENSADPKDTVRITAGFSKSLEIEYEPMDEEQAHMLTQLVAKDLSEQSATLSGHGELEVLRSFI